MYKIDKILIGTHNTGKFREISDLLPPEIVKISPNSLKIESPDETGKTFSDNSLLKAKFFCEKSKLVTLKLITLIDFAFSVLNLEKGLSWKNLL